MKILSIAQMRQVEQDCAKIGLPADVLMANAGRAVAEEVKRILGTLDNKTVLLLIGPGNNGGDGLVAARHLHDGGAKVSLGLCSPRPTDDPNLDLAQAGSIHCFDLSSG